MRRLRRQQVGQGPLHRFCGGRLPRDVVAVSVFAVRSRVQLCDDHRRSQKGREIINNYAKLSPTECFGLDLPSCVFDSEIRTFAATGKFYFGTICQRPRFELYLVIHNPRNIIYFVYRLGSLAIFRHFR